MVFFSNVEFLKQAGFEISDQDMSLKTIATEQKPETYDVEHVVVKVQDTKEEELQKSENEVDVGKENKKEVQQEVKENKTINLALKDKRGRAKKYECDPNVILALAVPDKYKNNVKKRKFTSQSSMKKVVTPLRSMEDPATFDTIVINVNAVVNVWTNLMSVYKEGRPRGFDIISGKGEISTVCLYHAELGGTITYEGKYNLLCLDGKFVSSDNGDLRKMFSIMSAFMCSTDGEIIYGEVNGYLLAAGPVQVVLRARTQI